MAKVRVYELAKELGVPSKDVMIRIQEMGEFARSASSTIEAPVVRKLKKSFEDERAQTSAGAARPPSTPPASTLSPGAPRPDPARLPDRVHDGRGRRALSLSIASFGGSTDSELELHTPLPLPFATVRAQALGQALTSFGYHWPKPLPSDRPAEMLGREVDGAISAADRDEVLVVHILSHGHLAESGAVYVMGSDGRTHALTDVEHWLKTVEDFPDRPYTLFLLDLCHSGVAARLPWQVALADGSSRAWVIAACEPDEQAFAGRFSQAAANVLDRLYRGQLDIDRSVRYVPLATVAREIRREVDKLAAAARALPQQVTCSVIDISAQVDLPFFLNPGYLEDERNEVRGRIDTALAPFLDDLDDAFDARHFIGRLPGTARWLTVSVTAVSAAATMS